MSHGLMSMKETAALLGVSRQRLAKLLEAHEDFPEPVATLAVGRIWKQRDVERWARKHGRTVTPPAATGS